MFTACALPAAIAGASNPARSVLATTASSAATPAPTAAATGSQSGSTALFVLLLVGLFLLVGVPYLIDLIWTNKRQDKVLELARTKQGSLSETEFDHLINRATRGTDGLNRALMAFAVIGIFAAALFYILVKNPDIKSSDIVGNAISALITLLTAIVAFYFGTRSAQTSAEASQPRPIFEPSPSPEEEAPVEEIPVEEAPVEETPAGGGAGGGTAGRGDAGGRDARHGRGRRRGKRQAEKPSAALTRLLPLKALLLGRSRLSRSNGCGAQVVSCVGERDTRP